jgi:hypothetical protein
VNGESGEVNRGPDLYSAEVKKGVGIHELKKLAEVN